MFLLYVGILNKTYRNAYFITQKYENTYSMYKIYTIMQASYKINHNHTS